MNAGATVYSRAGSAISCPLQDGLAILDGTSNRYFTLNSVGAFIWNALPGTNVQLAAEVAAHYDVSEAQAIADIAKVFGDLSREGLVCRVTQA